MEHISDKSKRAEEFKVEVSAYKVSRRTIKQLVQCLKHCNFQNTRHDNIALFLGYFMSDEKYGMVLSLSRGSQSLYALLHVTKEKLDLATTRKIAQQICQAVSYLHTKKILHKDLRTKNILIESKNKVVVTDYGVLSMKRLSWPKRYVNKLGDEKMYSFFQGVRILDVKILDQLHFPGTGNGNANRIWRVSERRLSLLRKFRCVRIWVSSEIFNNELKLFFSASYGTKCWLVSYLSQKITLIAWSTQRVKEFVPTSRASSAHLKWR